MRIGSLFSGAGGLDMAVQAVFGGETVWHCENDLAASKVLSARWPGVPNLGDITTIGKHPKVGWDYIEPVDILCGGFPCQDVSAAGRRAGIRTGTRSGLWAMFADAIAALRPRIVVVENVRGLLNARVHRAVESADPTVGDGSDGPVLRAAGAVLGDLADLGYDTQWATVAASDVGAPHRRERIFILATDTQRIGQQRPAHHPSSGQSDSAGRDMRLQPDRSGKTSAGWARGERRPVSHATRAVSGAGPLLPTPAVNDIGEGKTVEWWDEWTAKSKAKHGNGNEHGNSLAIEAQRISGAGPVNLLPTPRSLDATGVRGRTNNRSDVANARAGLTLTDVTEHLLPTPCAQQSGNTPENHLSKKPGRTKVTDLAILVENGLLESGGELLQTPSTADGDGSRKARGGNRSNEALLPGQAIEMATNWGKYEAAIRRWESLTRPAPPPTEPNTKGNPRLSAAFSEWMMGWPAGWVTAVPGISRNDALRIIGNGVVSGQAVAALTWLIDMATVA